MTSKSCGLYRNIYSLIDYSWKKTKNDLPEPKKHVYGQGKWFPVDVRRMIDELWAAYKELIIKTRYPFDHLAGVASMVIEATNNGYACFLYHLNQYDTPFLICAHSIRVCAVSVMLAKRLGYDYPVLKLVAIAALLHDLGFVRARPVRKGKVDLECMQLKMFGNKYYQHVSSAFALLSQLENADEITNRIVLESHEYLTGSGGPRKLRGGAIHQLSLLVGIAEYFCSIVDGSGWSIRRSGLMAVYYVASKIDCFGSRNIAAFLEGHSIFPPGSKVLLDNNQEAIVLSCNKENCLSPIVMLLGVGEKKEMVTVDLSKKGSPRILWEVYLSEVEKLVGDT